MSFCPYFKNGYFGSCTASSSNYVPSIAEMERYCFGDNSLCSILEVHTAKKYQTAPAERKYAAQVIGVGANPSEK